MKKSIFASVFALMMFVMAVRTEALTMNPFKGNGRVRATTLIVTGNYVTSRLLAELAQYYSKQPVLMFSPDAAGNQQIFFMPSPTQASPVPNGEFLDVVTYINPKRIIVLGGEDYVPRHLVDLVKTKFSVISLDSEDWSKNAAALGEALKVDKLQPQFNEAMKSIQSIEK